MHTGRVGNIVTFIAQAAVAPTTVDGLRQPTCDWLNQLPITPAAEQAMFQVGG